MTRTEQLEAAARARAGLRHRHDRSRRRYDKAEGYWERRCTVCREWWPEDKEFYVKWKRGRNGMHTQCKACWNAKRRVYKNRRRALLRAARTAGSSPASSTTAPVRA